MAGEIKHSWNGTILTITSDSGTSSMDLKGGPGDTGPRGPQGPCGVIIKADGTVDTSRYATEDWVELKIAESGGTGGGGGTINLDNYYTKSETLALIPDVSGFATEDDVATAVSGLASESFVTNKIAEAQLNSESGTVDLSGYATKDELGKYYTKTEVDEKIAEIDIEIPETDLTNYYTKTEIDNKGYQTEAQVNALIEAAGTGSGEEVDLSNYYTKSEVRALIPDTTQFATMAQVEDKGYQTEAQVLTAIYQNNLAIFSFNPTTGRLDITI